MGAFGQQKRFLLSASGLFFFLSVLPLTLKAELYNSQNLKLIVPTDLECRTIRLGQTVCQNPNTLRSRSDLLTIVESPKQNESSLGLESILAKPKELISPSGQSKVSTVLEAKAVTTNQQRWFRAEHFESELPKFSTVYWLTSTDRFDLLVTYSSHEDFKPRWTETLESLQKSFEVIKTTSESEIQPVAGTTAEPNTAVTTAPSSNEAPSIVSIFRTNRILILAVTFSLLAVALIFVLRR